jgi:hypothetical protein
MSISIKLLPRFIREAIFAAFAAELNSISASDLAGFKVKVLAALKRALAL